MFSQKPQRGLINPYWKHNPLFRGIRNFLPLLAEGADGYVEDIMVRILSRMIGREPHLRVERWS